MSTWTVTSTADDGSPGTLRSVIANSSAGDVVQFDPSVFTAGSLHTIVLAQVEVPITISHDLTIIGPGPDIAAISGAAKSQILSLETGTTVAISGVAINNGGPGLSVQEGGISSAANLTVSNCSFSNNLGAIWSTGTLTVVDSQFTDNRFGAIECQAGGLTVASCQFDQNNNGVGGAIECAQLLPDTPGGIVSISGSTFVSNTAQGGDGGAILISHNFAASIDSCTFVTNSAALRGGGVLAGDDTTINACTFTGNTAEKGGGLMADEGSVIVGYSTFNANSATDGGAIAFIGGTDANQSIQMFDSTLTDNEATTGGAIDISIPANVTDTQTITNCTIADNVATSLGGGVENETPAPCTLNNCIVAGNTLSDGSPSDITGAASGAFNLIGTGGSGGLSSGNQVGVVDPGLASLGNYQGPTQTMALLPGSPAFNAGSNSLAVDPGGSPLSSDQRGFHRVIFGTVDIGAYEAYAPTPPGQLTATAGADQVTLNWGAATALGPYSIYRGTTPGGEGAVPIAIGVPGTTFVDTGLRAGTTYYYQVTAANAGGESRRTNESTAVPFAPPPINGTAGDDALTLTRDPDLIHIDWTMGGASGQLPINDPDGQTIDGNGGSDTVILNYANGSPLPDLLNLNGMFTVTGLSGANPLAGKEIDIGTSTVYISYAGLPDPISLVRQYIVSGYNNGAWNGSPTPGEGVILSSAAQSNSAAAVGYADSSDGQGINTMPNTIELKYTLDGDANLDGQVNSADLQVLLFGLNRPGSWDQGDFNYDGQVNSADLQNLLFTLNTSLPMATAEAVLATSSPAAAPSAAVSSNSLVPRNHRADGKLVNAPAIDGTVPAPVNPPPPRQSATRKRW